MPSTSQLRIAIESQLSQRIPAALTPAVRLTTSYVSTGVSAVDELLNGLPVGTISEITGVHGSGRTALALAAVSKATEAGQVTAWVDVSCALDPESAAANHIALSRMLWVRCGQKGSSVHSSVSQSATTAFVTPQTSRVQHGGNSPHPRSEERGLSEAVNALLASSPKHRRDRVTGTPGAPNRRLQQTTTPRSRLSARIEQAGADRQPSRRGTYVLGQRERFTDTTAAMIQACEPAFMRRSSQGSKPWERIDQALRVTDLLLQAGGFGIVVLDLADIAAEFVSRVPMATWFRFRAGAEHAQSALLVLTQHACTGSSAGLVLKTEGLGTTESTTYFPGLRFSVEVGRQRFAAQPVQRHSSLVSIRKPPQRMSAAEWEAHSIWTGGL